MRYLLFLGLVFGLNPLFSQTFTTSNLPIVLLNTNGRSIPDEPKINATMTIVWKGSGQTNAVSDTLNPHFKGAIGIERRGSTSQDLSDKKPYSIETRDALGEDLKVGLLGMPKESDWALIAPYSDKTLMRDALTYQLAASFMAYAPRTRFCELVLNGQYQGVYVLTERIKRDKDRVNISKTDPLATTGDALTGGYILKFDKTTGNIPGVESGFASQVAVGNNNVRPSYQYEYPDPEDMTVAQKNYIKQAVYAMENAFRSPRYADTATGYPKYLDVKSTIDFLIMNELTRNVDGYRLSSYLYKDKNSINSKFFMGPVWDFNIALGNAGYCAGNQTSGWAFNFGSVCPDDGFQIPFFWNILTSNAVFRQQFRERWQALRQNELSFDRINALIDSMNTTLTEPANRNFQRWRILGTYVWPNSYVGRTYADEVTYMRNWLTNRIRWIDGAVADFVVTSSVLVEDIRVFPNPSSTAVQVDYLLNDKAKARLVVVNNVGQVVYEATQTQPAGVNSFVWKDAAPAGLYIYQLYFNDKLEQVGKLVKN